MKVIGVTFSDGEYSITLFKQDLERLQRICTGPSLFLIEECRRFAEDMVKRAVRNDTGEPVVSDRPQR